MSIMIQYNIPDGRAVEVHKQDKDGYKKIKELWKTVQYVIEDVEVPNNLSAKELLEFFDNAAFEAMPKGYTIYDRNELIESGMI